MIGKHCPIFAVNREVIIVINFFYLTTSIFLCFFFSFHFFEKNKIAGVDSYSKADWFHGCWSLQNVRIYSNHDYCLFVYNSAYCFYFSLCVFVSVFYSCNLGFHSFNRAMKKKVLDMKLFKSTPQIHDSRKKCFQFNSAFLSYGFRVWDLDCGPFFLYSLILIFLLLKWFHLTKQSSFFFLS